MTFVDDTRLSLVITKLKRLDAAPDREGHDKKCWWCAECGDDLAEVLKLLVIDAKREEKPHDRRR